MRSWEQLWEWDTTSDGEKGIMRKHRSFATLVLAVMVVSYLAACTSPVVPVNEQTPTEVPTTAQLETVVQTKLDTTPRIAVISAVEEELELLLSEAEIEDTYAIAGTTYRVGRLRGNDVVMFLSGMSMTNAAMTTQAAIDYFNVERIVYSGIAGGVNPTLNIGDVAIPARWGEYLDSWFAREVSGSLRASFMGGP
jgi:adenosylhomocysteine nucleosidase